ncbi:MAG: hypothetical protein HFJ29_06770 [Clostridia bacterium]|nr:hypothetical protein [Clostridia bacterium]
MKLSWIKYEKDAKSFRLPEALGFDVFKLQDLEQTDSTIKQLVKQNYDTIIVSNQVAGFSEDIIKKYQKDKEIKIVISLDKD